MSNSIEKIYSWIEAGKQIGKSFFFEKEGESCYTSIGVQKWSGVYKIHIVEMLEKNMCADEYDKRGLWEVTSIDEIAPLLAEHTHVTLLELTPLKGQKLFHPDVAPFDRSKE